MTHLKILIISTSYAQKLTGEEAAGSFVNAFVKDLNDTPDIEVKVIYPSLAKNHSFKYEKPFIVKFMPLSLLKLKNIFHWWHIFNTLRAGNKMVMKEVALFKPAHICALWALPCGYWAMKAAKKHKFNYSNWCLGSDIWSLSKIPLVKTVLKKVLQKSQYNFADGYQLCADVKKISQKDCTFLPSSRKLNHSLTYPIAKKNRYNLCFIGRWHENKGIDILLSSLKMLNHEDLKQINKITIAGGGPLKPLVRKQVAYLKKSGVPLVLEGFADTDRATELIIASDFMLIPSRIESIPVIFSDSIQLLRPVVAMPVGDLPLLLNRYNCGILSKSVTAAEFAKAISKAIRLDIKILNRDLDSTYRNFFENQKNHTKFISTIRGEKI